MNQAILLVNLGSPDSLAVPDVRRFLKEFLMDRRVMDVNWFKRYAIVNFGILRTRPEESVEAYRKIWTPEGSPLIVFSRRLQAKLQERLSIPVELAMRYQHPSIPEAMRRLAQKGVREVLLIPMFPHYAMSSYETVVKRVKKAARRVSPKIRVHVQPPYFDHPDYIAALVGSAAPYIEMDFDHLLFSFHGLPERHIRKSDPTGCHCLTVKDCCDVPSPAHATCYRAQCLKTVAAFVRETGMPKNKYSVSFQSRLGRDPWLKPHTDQELVALPSIKVSPCKVKKLVVICPAFVSDCLETLEEMGLRGRQTFLNAGGSEFKLIPCMNDHPLWVDALEKMAKRFAEAQPGSPRLKAR